MINEELQLNADHSNVIIYKDDDTKGLSLLSAGS